MNKPEQLLSVTKIAINEFEVEILCRNPLCGLKIKSVIGNEGTIRCLCGQAYHIIVSNPHKIQMKNVTKLINRSNRIIKEVS